MFMVGIFCYHPAKISYPTFCSRWIIIEELLEEEPSLGGQRPCWITAGNTIPITSLNNAG